MVDPYDLFDARERQHERDEAANTRYSEWYAAFWQRMRERSDHGRPPVIDGYDVVLGLVRRDRGLDAA